MVSRVLNHSDIISQPSGINVPEKEKANNNSTELSKNAERIDYLSNGYREISYSHGDEWRVNFAGLHRMVLAKLQEELIQLVGKIGASGQEVTKDVLANIESVLAKYTVAVRDWEYMVEHATRAGDNISKDLFVASSAEWLSHKLMVSNEVIEENWENRYLLRPPKKWESYLPSGQRRHVNAQKEEEHEKKERAMEEERQKISWQAKLERFRMSIFGGIALIAPMLLMALHNDRATALAVTSGSVLIFAIIVAVFTPAPPEVALGAVSAYAAVLVVFVGSTLSSVT